jgi:hypothetical protein
MRIVLPFCRDVPHGFYWDFLDGLTEAIRERGADAVRLPFARVGEHDAEELAALYRALEPGCDLFLDLCCWGYGLTRFGVQQPSAPPRPILDALGIRYAGMLFDHPHFQPINVVCAERLYATFPDLGHRAQAEFVFPGLALAGDAFAPPAVRAGNARVASRDIDVLYFGNLDFSTLDRPWRGSVQAALCDPVAGLLEEQPERPAYLALQEVLRAQGRSAAPQEIADVLRTLELYLRAKFRHDVIAALAHAGLRLVVVGRGWEGVALPGTVQRHAPLAYEEMFRLAARSRICIDASTYFSGANDRVFNYALNGAVCFTNAAGYLGREEWLRFYSMRELAALADDVRAALQDPRRLEETGAAARRAVLARHTWRDRLETILTTCLSSSPPAPRAP